MTQTKIATMERFKTLGHLLLFLLILSAKESSGQNNVGIGTTTPQAKLDVKGNLRTGGTNNFLLYDSLSGKFTWSNSSLWLPNSQYIIQHSASSEGLYYGNSQLEYRYQDGTPRFFTNWNSGNGYFYGRLGIGTVSPMAKLHVADSSVVFSGSGFVSLPANDPPVSGEGRRMMWYADKAAFRAGYVLNNEWNNDNIGPYSFAAGFNTKAIGTTSFAFGNQTAALANYSTAMGISTTAVSEYSTAIGNSSTARGTSSTVIGVGLLAKAPGAIVVGTNNDTLDAPNPSTPALTDRLFQIGNGTFSLSNAMTILRNGNTGIGTTTPQTPLHVKSTSSNAAIFDGGNGMWVTLAENGVERGYIGSYAGDPEDVELGTYGSTTGSVHLTTFNTPRLTVINNGNVGINTTTPNTLLHIRGGSAGGVTPNGYFALESTFPAYMNLLTPDGVESGVLFGINSDNVSGGVIYNNGATSKGLQFRTNGNIPRMVVTNNGNVGIGVLNPQRSLSVNGGMNIDESNLNNGGLDNNVLRFGVSSSGEAISSARTGGSNNQFGLDFYTASAKRMVISNTGNVGIGTSTPGFPLNFANNLGDKVALFGSSGSHYGFGIQNALLQIHTDAAGADIAFGYGSSGSLVEKFRMKGNGAFVVGGNAGSVGQILTSAGNATSPTWTNPLTAFYNAMTEYSQSASITITPQASFLLPAMSNLSIVITATSKLILSASVEVERNSCGGCGSSEASLLIQTSAPSINNWGFSTDFVFPSEKTTPTVAMKFLTLGPGTYTVNSYVMSGVGLNGTARSGRLNIIIVPQ